MIGREEARLAEAQRSEAIGWASISYAESDLPTEEVERRMREALDGLGIDMTAITTGLARLARQRGLGAEDHGRLVDVTDGYLHGFVDGALAGRIEARGGAADAGTGEGNGDVAPHDPDAGGSRG